MKLPLAALLATTMLVSTAGSTLAASAPQHQVGQANFYVTEFEKEVERAQGGGTNAIYRAKNDALDRVQRLKMEYPDDPAVEELFQRTKAALMKSKGNYTTIDPSWLAYRQNESNLRKAIAKEADAKWQEIMQPYGDAKITAPFPAPDSAKVAVDDIKGQLVILENVEYPNNQFYGATGEYVSVGKPSTGFYYVDISGRDWVGPYEAVKRYRRNVDTTLEDVTKWTVLGKITGIVADCPQKGEAVYSSFQFGWVVTPIALMVPGRVVAWYDEKAESSGHYAGEDKVDQIKRGWYTVNDVPADATPERVCEIFMTAIKEKNYELYRKCITPNRKGDPRKEDSLKYYWDLHQSRFSKEYVHATFDKAKILVIKGFDDQNEKENFFLDDKQRETLTRTQGTKVEQAVVYSRAFDENGKQVGSVHKRILSRTGNGPWYIEEYWQRF